MAGTSVPTVPTVPVYIKSSTSNILAKGHRVAGTNVPTVQFGTQVKFRWSRDHNNRTVENAFSAPWYYSEMEIEPVAG